MPDLDAMQADLAALAALRHGDAAGRRDRYAAAVATGHVVEPRAGAPVAGIAPRLGGCVMAAPTETRGPLHVVPLWIFAEALHVLTPCFETAEAANRFRRRLAMRCGGTLGQVAGEGIVPFLEAIVGCATAPVPDVGNARVAEVLGAWLAGAPLDLGPLRTGAPGYETVMRLPGGARWLRVANRAGAADVTGALLSDTLDRYHAEMSFHRDNATYSEWYALAAGPSEDIRIVAVVRVPAEGSLDEPEVAGEPGADPFARHGGAIAALAAYLSASFGPENRAEPHPGVSALGAIATRHGLTAG